jgi:hypothetical protein
MPTTVSSFALGKVLAVSGLLLMHCVGCSQNLSTRSLTAEERQSISWREEGGVIRARHPYLNFSLSLPNAQYRAMEQKEFEPEDSNDKSLESYGFVNPEDGSYLFVSILGASFDKEALQQYTEGWAKAAEGEILGRSFSWDNTQKESSFWVFHNDIYQRVRIINLELGPEHKKYLISLVGISQTEEQAQQLVDGFSM